MPESVGASGLLANGLKLRTKDWVSCVRWSTALVAGGPALPVVVPVVAAPPPPPAVDSVAAAGAAPAVSVAIAVAALVLPIVAVAGVLAVVGGAAEPPQAVSSRLNTRNRLQNDSVRLNIGLLLCK